MIASVFVGTSLDGFIARADDSFDFLPEGGGEPHGYDEFMASVGALVIGRRTFDVVLGFAVWPFGGKPVIVLTTRPMPSVPAGAVVERMSGEPREVVAALSARGIGHIYVDGGATVQSFLRAGCIHRIIVTRAPVLIGQGIPLFGPLASDIVLRHIGTRHFQSGLVQSEYHVVGASEPGRDIEPLWLS
ncbi:dihydrofolate reductase family protein [Terricaulis silvestris]|uniref:Dihydrofolate reductase n=1 Tax=Terricaulis silvestris TaxID=2686094 RepID=A0A6I6MH54_9CAUL|nr:dihydrofolate reductase family protein [Terricaulis silvestris]QGZ94135.1 Dihydrofolate reductase [Terricaulis silvestris]